MQYRYLDDFGRGISVFAIFSYGIAVLGTPQCPPPGALSPVLENFRHVLSPDPTDCPWVSEGGFK